MKTCEAIMTTLEMVKQLARELPVEERKLVVMDILDSLAAQEVEQDVSLLDLEGLGAEIWSNVDAAKYVDELRREWDDR
jgi:hypothetical protein